MGSATFTTRLAGVRARDLWSWHAAPGAFSRLTPAWADVRVLQAPDGLTEGATCRLDLPGLGPLRAGLTSTITHASPPDRFTDAGGGWPLQGWAHTHAFRDVPDGAELTDTVAWTLPLGALGEALGGPVVRRRLGRLFAFRHHRTSWDLRRHAAAGRPRTLGVTGATGLVGAALTSLLRMGGHTVVPFVRRAPRPGEIRWDPSSPLDPDALRGLDAVVHLAGEPVSVRWTPERKRRIHDSRVVGTATLAEAMARATGGPRVLVSASAVGFYGDRPEVVDEDAPPGTGFLASVVAAWEAAADPARDAGLRVVHPRIGIVQALEGGALAAMLPVFRLGLGGPVGSGAQGLPWIALDDVVDILYRCAVDDDLAGPVNAVAPVPETQRTHAATLGRVLCRPAWAPAPAAAVSLVFGEMGRELILGGATVRPTRLLERGFTWRHPELEGALRHILGRAGSE